MASKKKTKGKRGRKKTPPRSKKSKSQKKAAKAKKTRVKSGKSTKPLLKQVKRRKRCCPYCPDFEYCEDKGLCCDYCDYYLNGKCMYGKKKGIPSVDQEIELPDYRGDDFGIDDYGAYEPVYE